MLQQQAECELDWTGYCSPANVYRLVRKSMIFAATFINPLNAELNPIRHLLALVGARHVVHVSRVRVKVTEQWEQMLQSTKFIMNGVELQ